MASFDLKTTPPFMAFKALRDIATAHVGEANVLDLSQGEPGYGFAPNVRSRQFFGFLMLLDSVLNDHLYQQKLFADSQPEDLAEIEKIIKITAEENFQPEIAAKLLKDWAEFITKLEQICQVQNLNFNTFQVLYELFKYANLSGGRYPQPLGNPLLAAVSAEEYSEMLGLKVHHEELIQVMGASHGIGAVFKALGEEGIGFLQKGDAILMTSPVYAPYNLMFQQRGIEVVSMSIDPETGSFDLDEVEAIKKQNKRIKCVVIIDPNNPTGFAGDENLLQTLADIADAHDSIIVSDEVYFRFFENKKSIVNIPSAQQRTIRIDSLSKIERATGVRAGDIYISKPANEYITNRLLKDHLQNYQDFFTLMKWAKSPGGQNIGLFQHITGIPGPSVALALAHLILGKAERARYVEMIEAKMVAFYENLGLPRHGNFYYGMFDLRHLESETWKPKSMEDKLEALAQQGVVLMPAYLFFTTTDQQKKDCTGYVRVSLPNLSLENTKRAAQIIREVMAQ